MTLEALKLVKLSGNKTTNGYTFSGLMGSECMLRCSTSFYSGAGNEKGNLVFATMCAD